MIILLMRIINAVIELFGGWGTYYHIVSATQKKFEEDCREYDHIKGAMDNNDRETIEQYIKEQEQKSLTSYVKAFTTSKRYEIFPKTGQLSFEFVRIFEFSMNKTYEG